MTAINKAGLAWREAVRWEVCWVPVELAGVGLGLWLGEARDRPGVGGCVLLGTLVAGAVVRFRHYGSWRLVTAN